MQVVWVVIGSVLWCKWFGCLLVMSVCASWLGGGVESVLVCCCQRGGEG